MKGHIMPIGEKASSKPMKSALLLSAFALALAACGGDEPATTANAPEPVTASGDQGASAESEEPKGRKFVRLDPADLLDRKSSDDLSVMGTLSDDGSYLLITGEEDDASNARPGGYALKLPKAVEDMASGQRITISLDVESGSSGLPASFDVSYSTREVGNSGWQSFQVSGMETVEFDYKVKPIVEGKGDWLGIVPRSAVPVRVYSLTISLAD